VGRFQQPPRADYVIQEQDSRRATQFSGKVIQHVTPCQSVGAMVDVAKAGNPDLWVQAAVRLISFMKDSDITAWSHQAANFGSLSKQSPHQTSAKEARAPRDCSPHNYLPGFLVRDLV